MSVIEKVIIISYSIALICGIIATVFMIIDVIRQ